MNLECSFINKIFFQLVCLLLVLSFHTKAQDQLLFKANTIPDTDTVWVFTPVGYDPAARSYPAVVLLHGYGANYKQWNDIMGAQHYADEYGFIVICPDGFRDSWYINSPVKKDHQYADFFFKYFLPSLKQKYRLDADNLFISGLSMGGHGALFLFSQRPDLFRSAGSTSGVLDLRSSAKKYGLTAILGELATGQVTWIRFSVMGNIEKIAAAKKEIIFDCGVDDRFYEVNNQLREVCLTMNIPATFISQPGNHDKVYWQKSIRQHFEFFKRLSLQSVHE
ncbi:MAG: alpha/beta hydrolase family protein [Bacteroidota bacterium]